MKRSKINFILSIVLPFVVGAIIMALLGHDPVEAYEALFKGAFVGKFSFGTTIEKFVPILLTGLAYALTSKVKYFNLGVEGSFYMGALFSAGAGFLITGLPWYIHIPLCFIIGTAAGAAWAVIPGMLRAFLNVNESCTTIMLNYVAQYFALYMIVNAWSSKGIAAQTMPILKSAELTRILPPSRANTGIFLALILCIVIYWMVERTSFGFKVRSTGSNPYFSEYMGISTKKIVVLTVAISGAIGGFAGTIETLGIYGCIIYGFSNFTAFDGMLASLIAKNNIVTLPIYAFMIAALKSGALGMERMTGVPKSLIDTLVPVLIILISMERLFSISTKLQNKFTKKTKQSAQAPTVQ